MLTETADVVSLVPELSKPTRLVLEHKTCDSLGMKI